MTNPENNPIGYLTELCQKYLSKGPEYDDINVSGPAHCREFTCKCRFEGLETIGKARQKKQAKSEAAKAMVALMRESSFFDKFQSDGNLSGTELNLTTMLDVHSKNPISVLNEYCQQKYLPPPKYVCTIAGGVFSCECEVNENKAFGHGSNKKSAKTEAALKMCLQLEINCNGIGCADAAKKVLEKLQNINETSNECVRNKVSKIIYI
jgi:dsRNA-specific ribonuclease